MSGTPRRNPPDRSQVPDLAEAAVTMDDGDGTASSSKGPLRTSSTTSPTWRTSSTSISVCRRTSRTSSKATRVAVCTTWAPTSTIWGTSYGRSDLDSEASYFGRIMITGCTTANGGFKAESILIMATTGHSNSFVCNGCIVESPGHGRKDDDKLSMCSRWRQQGLPQDVEIWKHKTGSTIPAGREDGAVYQLRPGIKQFLCRRATSSRKWWSAFEIRSGHHPR